MTPKKKAIELIDKFCATRLYDEQGKECALIAVDEIIKDRERLKDAFFYCENYWQEVKIEIEKL